MQRDCAARASVGPAASRREIRLLVPPCPSCCCCPHPPPYPLTHPLLLDLSPRRSERVAGIDGPNYNENARLLSLADGTEGSGGGRDRRLMRGETPTPSPTPPPLSPASALLLECGLGEPLDQPSAACPRPRPGAGPALPRPSRVPYPTPPTPPISPPLQRT